MANNENAINLFLSNAYFGGRLIDAFFVRENGSADSENSARIADNVLIATGNCAASISVNILRVTGNNSAEILGGVLSVK